VRFTLFEDDSGIGDGQDAIEASTGEELKQKAKEAIAQAKARGFKPRYFRSAHDSSWTDWARWNREPVCAIRFSDGSEWNERDGWSEDQERASETAHVDLAGDRQGAVSFGFPDR
jgi:hypothetical protein